MATGRPDRAAWERVYRDAYPGVFRALVATLFDEQAAAEAMRGAFEEGTRRAPPQGADLSGWLFRVALRTARRARLRARAAVPLAWLLGVEREAHESAEAVLDRGAAGQLLRLLTERQRAVVVAHFSLDLAPEDVAALLGVRRGTVDAAISRALARMPRERTVSDLGDAFRIDLERIPLRPAGEWVPAERTAPRRRVRGPRIPELGAFVAVLAALALVAVAAVGGGRLLSGMRQEPAAVAPAAPSGSSPSAGTPGSSAFAVAVATGERSGSAYVLDVAHARVLLSLDLGYQPYVAAAQDALYMTRQRGSTVSLVRLDLASPAEERWSVPLEKRVLAKVFGPPQIAATSDGRLVLSTHVECPSGAACNAPGASLMWVEVRDARDGAFRGRIDLPACGFPRLVGTRAGTYVVCDEGYGSILTLDLAGLRVVSKMPVDGTPVSVGALEDGRVAILTEDLRVLRVEPGPKKSLAVRVRSAAQPRIAQDDDPLAIVPDGTRLWTITSSQAASGQWHADALSEIDVDGESRADFPASPNAGVALIGGAPYVVADGDVRDIAGRLVASLPKGTDVAHWTLVPVPGDALARRSAEGPSLRYLYFSVTAGPFPSVGAGRQSFLFRADVASGKVDVLSHWGATRFLTVPGTNKIAAVGPSGTDLLGLDGLSERRLAPFGIWSALETTSGRLLVSTEGAILDVTDPMTTTFATPGGSIVGELPGGAILVASPGSEGTLHLRAVGYRSDREVAAISRSRGPAALHASRTRAWVVRDVDPGMPGGQLIVDVDLASGRVGQGQVFGATPDAFAPSHEGSDFVFTDYKAFRGLAHPGESALHGSLTAPLPDGEFALLDPARSWSPDDAYLAVPVRIWDSAVTHEVAVGLEVFARDGRSLRPVLRLAPGTALASRVPPAMLDSADPVLELAGWWP